MYELNQIDYIQEVSKLLDLKPIQVDVVLALVSEWATVPFISRYRKEKTWNLDENQVRAIIENQSKLENIYNAKVTAINWILELWKMTDELFENIKNAKTLKEVEELYKPYKSKKKTKAMIALEKGFWVVAESLKLNKIEIPESLLKDFPREEIIDWAIEIVWSEVNANSSFRHKLIEELKKYWMISSSLKSEKMLEKLNDKDKEQIPKFDLYKEASLKIAYIKPYQILALNRWENIWILTVKIEKDEIIFDKIMLEFAKSLNIHTSKMIEELKEAFKRWYENLFSSVENEIRWDLNEIAQDSSILTFQTNLKALLLTKPESARSILAIDPGFRVWCKLCVIDSLWNPVKFDKIYLHELASAKFKIKDLIQTNNVEVVVVWNWTWSKEVCALVWEIFDKDIFVVNEAWASVYSVSKTWEEEFPNLDSLDRWTVSIGRRFLDPLSELVKVPVWSIWVWMYQHDMPAKKLDEKLWDVVVDAVNEVWINVNTASIHVLNHISWIDKRQAKKIFDKRPYSSRKELKKVLWEKAYEQSIWFLRVPNSQEPLDNTDIHPEQYELAKYIIENNITPNSKIDDTLKSLYPEVSALTIEFILNSYKEIWVEKRKNSTHTKANTWNVEIKQWDIVEGTVRNVVAFWAFVDIWMKNDWLVHVSQISDTFVKNPMEVLTVWDKVKVKVTLIDEKWKIQLTMKWL